jgi:hypothetical protein
MVLDWSHQFSIFHQGVIIMQEDFHLRIDLLHIYGSYNLCVNCSA